MGWEGKGQRRTVDNSRGGILTGKVPLLGDAQKDKKEVKRE